MNEIVPCLRERSEIPLPGLLSVIAFVPDEGEFGASVWKQFDGLGCCTSLQTLQKLASTKLPLILREIFVVNVL